MIEHHEEQASSFTGTIIDIETIGDYCQSPKRDSRRYKDLKMVVFGYINQQGLHIYCAEEVGNISALEEMAKGLLVTLVKDRPLHAFNCHQEMGVFFHRLALEIVFDSELQSVEYEKKEEALGSLGVIESYGDPFHSEFKPGNACRMAWERGSFDKALLHNRACLLKERELLLKGRGTTPIPLDFKLAGVSSLHYQKAYQTWTKEEEDYIKKEWDAGKTLKTIAQAEVCQRTSKAVWFRLQKLGKIPSDIGYTIEKDSWTISELL